MVVSDHISEPPLHRRAPSPSPSPSSSSTPTLAAALLQQSSPPPSSNLPIDFSPPLIAMVVVVAAAFLLVICSRFISRHLIPPILHLLRRRRRPYLPSSSADLDSLPYHSPFHPTDPSHPIFSISPYGLDDSVIKTIPLSLYTTQSNAHLNDSRRDCAVCLLEFQDNDYVRTLPACTHAFHVHCIDAWLRSHANCPLCRAGIFRPESPFVPIMSTRIRPSLDDETFLHGINREPLLGAPPPMSHSPFSEITPWVEDQSPRRSNTLSEDRFNGGEFLLKRSYSFEFERSMPSERMVVEMEPTTVSPCTWRHRRGSSFWSKRPSPFGSLGKPRGLSFGYYRGTKSPFFRRKGLFPLSESRVRLGGGSSWRRNKASASPMFVRSSSRLRCGDPEALLSPERFNRR